MLSKKMAEALNKQLNAELYSAYLYYAMSAYFESVDLAGAAGWMRCQAQEELVHASKFFTYIHERDSRVALEAIEQPPEEWESPLAAFEAAYQHEQKVSGLINGLVSLAREEGDHMTDNSLQWFVAEQVEEESSVNEVVRKLKLAGQVGGGLYLVDQELGQRVFTLAPTPAGAGE